MFVGVGRVNFFIHHANSLKSKRQVVRKLTAQVRNKFNAACAEVAENNVWKKAVIGITIVGNDASIVNSHLDKIINFMESLELAEMTEQQVEIISYSDGEPLS